ncbi:hypothetical protein ACVWY2_005688 [Bradyrhizobium sp. JR6.1]
MPVVLFADQPAGGVVVVHHTGRIAVDAHLVLDRAAGDAVALAERAVGIDQHLGNDEQRDALDAGRRAFDARQHQVDDVLGEVMLAGGDEDLGARDLEAAVGLAHRLGAEQTEIGAALRLGQVHGAGPLAGDHLRHIGLLLLGGAVHQERGGRAHGQPAIHRECHVGGDLEFVDRLRERHRQALAAKFSRRRQAEPAAFGDLLEGFLEAFRRGDAAVVIALAAFEIACAIERLQHLFAELGGLAKDRLAHIGRRIGEAGKIAVAIDLENVVQQEADVFDGGFVGRHADLPAGSRSHARPMLLSLSLGLLERTLSGSEGPRQVLARL